MDNNTAALIVDEITGKTIESIIEHNTHSWDGYKITFVGGEHLNIKLSNGQCCCENWGVSIVEPNNELNESNTWINKQINQMTIELSNNDDDNNESSLNIKVEFITNDGKFTIILYNEHNGYYSHDYFIETTKLHMKGSI